MQSVSTRIWTRVAVSISYDDNHYTTDTSMDSGFDSNQMSKQKQNIFHKFILCISDWHDTSTPPKKKKNELMWYFINNNKLFLFLIKFSLVIH